MMPRRTTTAGMIARNIRLDSCSPAGVDVGYTGVDVGCTEVLVTVAVGAWASDGVRKVDSVKQFTGTHHHHHHPWLDKY